MRFAYADPPYPGQAKRHYAADPSGLCAEVNHIELISHLECFDGWALSTSSTALRSVLPLCPPSVRVGAWVKPFAIFKPGVNPAYAWEPVILSPCRSRGREVATLRDWCSVNITLKRGTHGAKPDAFCFWLFEVCGLDPDDEFEDTFPGSGAVTRAWEVWKRQGRLVA